VRCTASTLRAPWGKHDPSQFAVSAWSVSFLAGDCARLGVTARPHASLIISIVNYSRVALSGDGDSCGGWRCLPNLIVAIAAGLVNSALCRFSARNCVTHALCDVSFACSEQTAALNSSLNVGVFCQEFDLFSVLFTH
jgi:hypothetical protein